MTEERMKRLFVTEVSDPKVYSYEQVIDDARVDEILKPKDGLPPGWMGRHNDWAIKLQKLDSEQRADGAARRVIEAMKLKVGDMPPAEKVKNRSAYYYMVLHTATAWGLETDWQTVDAAIRNLLTPRTIAYVP